MKEIQRTLPRFLTAKVEEALRAFPAVVLTGARQTGKSTLIRELLGGPARQYLTLDDLDVLERARAAPHTLVPQHSPVTIDEIQRSPDLMLAIKSSIDQERRPGRFLLSGSANLALLESVSESLAGRAVYLVLHPLTLGERGGKGSFGRWEELLDAPESLEGRHPAFELSQTLVNSGFPPAHLAEFAPMQQKWLDSYVMTYLERDLQAVSAIDRLIDFRRLMRIAALRTGAVINQADMARDAGISAPTAHRYLNLLEASYLIHRLPAYAVNRTKRLVKSPRLFYTDVGLAARLAGIETVEEAARINLVGRLLENVVLSDLLAWREAALPRPEILYWRTTTGAEVDFVVERRGQVIPLEVKATDRPRLADAASLELFLSEYGDSAPHGILLHAGERTNRLGERIWSVPLGAVIG